MKTITTTREYDAEGRLVKETVSEIVTPDAPIVTYGCTCGTSAICALHGRSYWQPTWYSYSGGQIVTGNTAAALS